MSFPAKYPGACALDCEHPIRPGDLIEYTDDNQVRHTDCPTDIDLTPGVPCPECWLIHRGDCP